MSRHAVTGALGFSGRHIAGRLVARGDTVVNLTNHPDRPDPFRGGLDVQPLDFARPSALARALDGVDTLFNTYWVRFPHDGVTHASAVRNSRILFEAAREAGVRRIVHVSIANPDPASHFAYYRGKAQVEQSLAASGVGHAILRPTMLFGDEPILANTIAWLLRHLPVFGIPGDGRYALQPIAVEDLAAIALDAAARNDDLTWDAAGPEVFSFTELLESIRAAIGSRTPFVHLPPPVALVSAAVLGRAIGDVLLTREELEALMAGLLVSHEQPRGTTRLTDWLDANGTWLGRRYLNEVGRHFAPA
jgi:NADH dehydrogenase